VAVPQPLRSTTITFKDYSACAFERACAHEINKESQVTTWGLSRRRSNVALGKKNGTVYMQQKGLRKTDSRKQSSSSKQQTRRGMRRKSLILTAEQSLYE
jgi:hypothetical protein